MSKRYRLELSVDVEEGAIDALMALGRKASADRSLSPEEDIPDVMAALMEIVAENPLLNTVAVEITEMTCTEDSEPLTRRESDYTEDQNSEDDDGESFAGPEHDADLDEYEPRV